MPTYFIQNRTSQRLYVPPPVNKTFAPNGNASVYVAASEMEVAAIRNMVSSGLLHITASDNQRLSDDLEVPVLSMIHGGGGGVASVTGIAPIDVTPGVNPVVSHNATGVVADTYGDASNSARLTVDAKGHVTAATQVPISITVPIGTFILGTGPIQTISADTDQITPVAPLHRIQVSGGNKALTSTPQINLPGAVLGQIQFVQNVGASFHVDLARGVAEGLSLSNANKRLDPGGTFMFVFNGSLWVEVTHTQGTTT